MTDTIQQPEQQIDDMLDPLTVVIEGPLQSLEQVDSAFYDLKPARYILKVEYYNTEQLLNVRWDGEQLTLI